MNGIISTILQNCRRCYSCIRECPSNAIKVSEGQAVVIPERCISCGHCVKVCSQNAKYIRDDTKRVEYFFNHDEVYAIVAPSFAASFPENYKSLPTALRELGFKGVYETAFGADLISDNYRELYLTNDGKTIISTPCPAVYNLVEKYYPELLDSLARIVSPMIAMGKYLREKFGNSIKIVFIGPCTAKKFEIDDEDVSGNIDAAIIFNELKQLLKSKGIKIESLAESGFDSPNANYGKSFPLIGGLLDSSGISHDILASDVVTVEGKEKTLEILNEVTSGNIKSKFIDILFCEGCINGPAIDSELNYFSRRETVIEYISESLQKLDKKKWRTEIYNNRNIEVKRKFRNRDQRCVTPEEKVIEEILIKSGKGKIEDQLNCGACGYNSCRENAIAIANGLAEEEMCLPYLVEKLEKINKQLKETRNQLNHAEKLASVGQLAAGLAHEINNPLGSIIMYSALIKKELKNHQVNDNIYNDLNLILNEAERCSDIVKKLLNFAREEKITLSEFSILSLLKEVIEQFNMQCRNKCIILNDKLDKEIITADKDQLKQVFINLIKNALDAVEGKENPLVKVTLERKDNRFIISIEDNGCGILEENMKKLFTPFFTTKTIGKGVGLGLAISYGIIKLHKGEITVFSKPSEGSKFVVYLPERN